MYSRAIEIWERIKKADPSDSEAGTKIKNLAASETIARSKAHRAK